MSRIRTIALTVCAAALAATAALAQPPSHQTAPDYARSARQRQSVAQNTSTTSGGKNMEQLEHQNRQLKGLLKELQAGKTVDPSEIDRVLRETH